MRLNSLICSHYKNKVEQKPGWNKETIKWCLEEAKKAKLTERDYWGALVLDEMKIQVIFISGLKLYTCTVGNQAIYINDNTEHCTDIFKL